MENETINIPIQARCRCTDTGIVKIAEVREDVEVKEIARLFAESFGLAKAVED